MKSALVRGAILAGIAASAALTSGCSTDAYCFRDCDDTVTENGGAGGGLADLGGHGGGLTVNSGGMTGIMIGTGGSNSSGCVPTNGGNEICDGLDNDCNGIVDDGVDFTDPHNCGACGNNCYAQFANADATSVTCTPSGMPGKAGKCAFSKCAQDFFDFDKDPTDGCEASCVKTASTDVTCDNRDDDCNGVVDDGVDKCTDATNCGVCGNVCSVPHAAAKCVHSGDDKSCTAANTSCVFAACDAGYVDLDKSPATGCEYQCTPTNGGVEKCGDGIDNDCDGKIDGADDDLSGDPQLGQPCFGAPNGVCATADHGGLTACEGVEITCEGPAILTAGQTPETCNGLDDDCDGIVDNQPTDVGAVCGAAAILPCKTGVMQCVMGALVCIGVIQPSPEICDGIDNDCDGAIDSSNGQPPSDSIGDCNSPPPPPAGATSGCKAGSKACTGGVVTCSGAIVSTAVSDLCGVDANCDGILSGQPDTDTDVHNCGGCGNDCDVAGGKALFTCTGGKCGFTGCQPGYVDKNGDHSCSYACVKVSDKEVCNGKDDNCDGQIDEVANLTKPSPQQQCGVAAGNAEAECTTQLAITCDAGKWACHFPAGVCSPTCATAEEKCDAVDNNCDGRNNENVPTYGKACASDDGKAAPGDGACRTTGTFVCNGDSAVKCSAAKADCTKLANGCTELCDGIDNDCDGLVDEPFSNKGTNPAYFVEPAVTKIGAALWMYDYEASRPTATTIVPGTGNGYQTSAPAGVTIDKTPACSVPDAIPWFNVTGTEAEQTCAAEGGTLCTTAQWQGGCEGGGTCKWGYAPAAQCATASLPTKAHVCNLTATFDADTATAGQQSELIVTGSSALTNCWADWSALQGNTAANGKIFDITGNLRELTKTSPNLYTVMGGSFETEGEDGATCGFTFYQVDQTFSLYDTGFRCCFTKNPDL